LKSIRFVPDGTVDGSPKTEPSDGSTVSVKPGTSALGFGAGAPEAAGAALSGATLTTGDADAWAAPPTAADIPPSSTTAPENEPEPAAVEQAPKVRAPMASSTTERRITKLNLSTIDSGLVDAAFPWSGDGRGRGAHGAASCIKHAP
jgi:hypothetical protein